MPKGRMMVPEIYVANTPAKDGCIRLWDMAVREGDRDLRDPGDALHVRSVDEDICAENGWRFLALVRC